MTQRPLFQQRGIERAIERKAVKKYMDSEKHDEANRIAAGVILADVEKYGGEQSALVRWARMWTARMAQQ